MITTTLGALVNSEPALQRLAELKLPVKTAYQVAKLGRLILVETQHFHKERQRYFKEMGEVRKPVNDVERAAFGQEVIAIRPDQVEIFKQKMDELSHLPISLDWQPITLTALGDVEISATDLHFLAMFVVDGEVR